MVSLLAAAICAALVAYLFWDDRKLRLHPVDGLWVPLAWMFLAGSRWASSWLNLGQPLDSVDSYSEGSPVDRAVFFALIVAGLVVLARREVSWRALFSNNMLLVLYLLYCLVSVTWSDEPYVAFKRWFKDLGNPVMVLVIVTSRYPLEALTTLLRQLAYLLLPLSVLFVKYLPELGRTYHIDGSPMYTGVGHQKNDLGLMCLISGTYFLWLTIQMREQFLEWKLRRRCTIYGLSAMMCWLLYMSNSQTALACLLIAGTMFAVGRLPPIKRQPTRIVPTLLFGFIVLAILDLASDARQHVFEMLGRNPTLTNRTELWGLLSSLTTNPWVGSGFMSFWTGERMEVVWKAMGPGVNQAHSGYLEQLLNLGYVGLLLTALLVGRGLANAWRQLSRDTGMAMLRMVFIVIACFYNYTEASFYGINNMWVLLLVGVISQPPVRVTASWKSFAEHTVPPRAAPSEVTRGSQVW